MLFTNKLLRALIMKIFEEDINIKDTQRVVVEIPKQWVSAIDLVCEQSFSPRRTWVVDAIHKKLKETGLLGTKSGK
jgi:hypothetical protein